MSAKDAHTPTPSEGPSAPMGESLSQPTSTESLAAPSAPSPNAAPSITESEPKPVDASPTQDPAPARSPFDPILPSRSAPRVTVRRNQGAGTFSPAQSAPFGERGGDIVQEFDLREPETAFDVGYREPGRRRPVVRRRTVDVEVGGTGVVAPVIAPTQAAAVAEEPEVVPAETPLPDGPTNTDSHPPPSAAPLDKATDKDESAPSVDDKPIPEPSQETTVVQAAPKGKAEGGEEGVSVAEGVEVVANAEVEAAARKTEESDSHEENSVECAKEEKPASSDLVAIKD